MKKVVIIGAGPAGSYAAKLLAEQGFDVELFEEHKQIGQPVQCTGLVTREIFELVKKGNFIVNELNCAKVIAPNQRIVEIPLKEFVIDRAKFDSELARQAMAGSVRLTLGARFVGIKDGRVLLKQRGKIIRKRADILIGADGPLSSVAKAAGLWRGRKFYFGQQARVKGKFDKSKFTTYLGKVAPDFFGWVVPESRAVARIGLASKEKARELFDRFVKGVGGKIIDRQAGLIPIYSPFQQIETDFSGMRVFLIGDAAGFVKATTGGGIISGLRSAKILAECIAKGKNYPAAARKLRMDLLAHLLLRKTMNNLSEKDYIILVKLTGSNRVKKVLAEATREQPIALGIKLAIAEPRLLKFWLRLFL
jgi:geranylgeranyl reductase family protein